MSLLISLRSLASMLFQRSRIDAEMEEELRSHIQHRADDLERSGLTRAEAERRARVEFGGYERYKEESYEALGGKFLETLLQDVRFGLRMLRKSPGFTAIAVITLALGISANAVVFSVLNGLILRPLNVPESQRLFTIQRGKDPSPIQSYPDYLDLRDRNRSLDGVIAYAFSRAGLNTGGNASTAWLYEASGNYFDVLGIRPYLGQFFHASNENGPNSSPYLVLSYAYWMSHFQGDRGMVGRRVEVNKHPFTVLGVAPPRFRGTELYFTPDFWVPLVNEEQVGGGNDLDRRGVRGLSLAGRLKPGVTTVQAEADLNSIAAYLAKNYPKEDDRMFFSLARPGLMGDFLGRPVRAFLSGMMLLAGLILLAACANLGNLSAARAADRSREIALRLALGSSRKRVLRQLLTEATLVSLMGGAVGLLGAVVLLRWLSVWQPISSFPANVPVNPDGHVFVVAVLLALLSGLLFGIVPVRQVLRANPWQIVKAGSADVVGRRLNFRDLLLVLQIAACAVLVTSSLVAVRGLLRSLHSNFGFTTHNAMLVETDVDMAGYSADQVPIMQKRMIDAMEAIPGVTAAAASDMIPLDGQNFSNVAVFTDSTTDLRPSNAVANTYTQNISAGYFHAAGTALLAGRTFTPHDDKRAPRVAVVNREFARRVFGSEVEAAGGFYKAIDGTRIQVVGVVENGRYRMLTEDPQPAAFLPILQSPSSSTWLIVRSNHDPQELTAAIEGTLRNLDAGLPFSIRTWDKEMDSALFASRVATASLGVLGGLGAMLAVTGIFGMASYSVSKRMRELGIRIALGAQRKEVLRSALGRTWRLLAFGSAVGLLLGIAATRVLSSIVYQATPRDPLVLAGVVLAMLLLGLLATWIPAQRALGADLLALLREE
jgi:macrolide transport system ATP-binding/permease protein